MNRLTKGIMDLKYRFGDGPIINQLPMMILGFYMIVISITCFFLTLYFKDTLAFSGNQIGMLYSIQAVTGMLAALPAGIGLDRISSRTIAVAGLLIQSICFVFMGLVQSFFVYAGVFLVWSLSSWVFRMSIDVHVLKTMDKELPAHQIGVYQAWRFAGLTIGILIAGYAIRFLAFSISRMAAGGCGNNYFLSIHMAIPLYDRPSGYKIFRKEDSNEYHSRFLQCF